MKKTLIICDTCGAEIAEDEPRKMKENEYGTLSLATCNVDICEACFLRAATAFENSLKTAGNTEDTLPTMTAPMVTMEPVPQPQEQEQTKRKSTNHRVTREQKDRYNAKARMKYIGAESEYRKQAEADCPEGKKIYNIPELVELADGKSSYCTISTRIKDGNYWRTRNGQGSKVYVALDELELAEVTMPSMTRAEMARNMRQKQIERMQAKKQEQAERQEREAMETAEKREPIFTEDETATVAEVENATASAENEETEPQPPPKTPQEIREERMRLLSNANNCVMDRTNDGLTNVDCPKYETDLQQDHSGKTTSKREWLESHVGATIKVFGDMKQIARVDSITVQFADGTAKLIASLPDSIC